MVPPLAWTWLLSAAAYYWKHTCDKISTPVEKLLPSYDFIVVGGGTAGSVVASRLSEISSWNVLLLEQGGSDNEYADIPFIFLGLEQSVFARRFNSTKQRHACLSLPGAKCPITVGNGLGGGSTHNSMIFNRGSRRGFDEWANNGAPGWSYADVLPYFKKLESVPEKSNWTDRRLRGLKGPQTVEMFEATSVVRDFWLNPAKELGYQIGDYNGKFPNRFSQVQMSTKNGLRWSSQRAYLDPALPRPNLHVVCLAKVHKIHFKGKKAVAVKFERHEQFHEIKVDREVILSAGTVQSPQLLMVSGIGPPAVLKEAGIDVVHPLKGVGMNFHSLDTFTIGVRSPVSMFPYQMESLTPDDYFDLVEKKSDKLLYKGAYGIGVHAPMEDPFDTQFVFFFDPYFYESLSGVIGSQHASNVFYLSVVNLKPKSRGRITITSKNIADNPVIDFNCLSAPEDREELKRGLRLLLRINATSIYQNRSAAINDIVIDECKGMEQFSDKHLDCLLKYHATQNNNYVGTCKMGQPGDPLTVVDPSLKLRGIANVRVIDASIMPNVTRANTNAAVQMIAEKGSDLIKRDHNML